MKIPKKLKVGQHSFKINITKARDESKGSENWGKTKFSIPTIYLDQELSLSKREETFLHEIIHICFDQAGIDRDEKEEEYLVNAITNQLYPILKANKLI